MGEAVTVPMYLTRGRGELGASVNCDLDRDRLHNCNHTHLHAIIYKAQPADAHTCGGIFYGVTHYMHIMEHETTLRYHRRPVEDPALYAGSNQPQYTGAQV